MSTHGRDSGSMVVGWLVKLAVVLTLLGIVGFDGISLAVTHLNSQDDANSAASAAAETWQQTHSAQQAYQAAVDSAGSNDTVIAKTFTIDADGTVHLSLTRKATTLVMYRIGPLKKYVEVTAKGEAGPPTS
jgi:hypothetical protein